MKHIEVLGTGCKKCVKTAEMLQAAADERHIEAKVEKITDPARIMAYQVMATPAVAIDGKLVHSGGVPDRKQIDQWLGD